MNARRVVILLLGLVFVRVADSSVLGPEECFSPLEQWCGDHECPSYQESVAALERLDASVICHQARRGTCGELRYTTLGNPTSSITHYFGPDGRVVGVTTSSDAQHPAPCDGGWRHYGSGLFRCTLVTEREYCVNPQTKLDPRSEAGGRIVDAVTGQPLQGAVVITVWYTELMPNPAAILFGLTIGGHGGSQQRVARVLEVSSQSNGRFLIPAWTEADQLRRGPIVQGSAPFLFAFLPGYEPVSWFESEPEAFGSMSAPRSKVLRMRPSGAGSAEKVRRFSQWLDMHVSEADDPEAPQDSRLRVQVKGIQQRASTMAGEELKRLTRP